MRTFIRVLLVVFTLVFTGNAFGAIIPFHERIYTPHGGTAVQIGQPAARTLVHLTPGGSNPHLDRVKNGVVTFGVDHHYPVYFSSMHIKIELLVKRWTNVSVPTSSLLDTTLVMEISYSPNDSLSFTDKQSIMLPGIEKYSVEIKRIWVNDVATTELPANLYIDADLYVDRYYDFAVNAETAIHILQAPGSGDLLDMDCDGRKDVLRLYWPAMAGAEEYQLEWTFINDYDAAPGTWIPVGQLRYDFKGNSTRISTTATSYDLSLAFDHGYICYRVRAVGRDITDPTLSQRIFGVWSSDSDAETVDMVAHFYHNWSYEGNKNWQYASTYAEEGKKKEVISFFDGSLRNRQMVTKINSDRNTIVGETIYDHQGRPVIQVLPVPVTNPVCSPAVTDQQTSLKFYPDFNQNPDKLAYSRVDFDISDPSDSCGISSRLMSTVSGASNYYSSDNVNQTGKQGYVPDASGRPFSQVEYTPDNTGRIRRQSGVGKGFELGSSHETKYYYGHPTQIQLDRMFGSEVGDVSHYQKNMVIDPNGQVSVSYLDQEGRVIATSLAGEIPLNLQGIASSSEGAQLTDDLFARNAEGKTTSNVLSDDNKTLTFKEVMLLTSTTSVVFDYTLIVDTLYDPCLSDNICFSCVYDLSIEVFDECGVEITSGMNLTKQVGRFTTNASTHALEFSTTCQEGSSETNLHENFMLKNLTAGSYLVSKKLTVNESAKDFYVDAYLKDEINSCLKTLEDFETEYLSQVDFDACKPIVDCDSCLTSIGNVWDYVNAGKGTAEEYRQHLAACQSPCKEASVCEVTRDMMLSDLSPGGQYAEYVNSDGLLKVYLFPLSIFNDENYLPNPNAYWKNPAMMVNGALVSGYFDEDGVTRSRIRLNSVTFASDGVTVTATVPSVSDYSKVYADAIAGEYYTYPEFLSNIFDFKNKWQNSWANSLLVYHPEYYFYKTCLEYTVPVNENDAFTSESFDQLISRIDKWEDAVTAGLLKSSGTSPMSWLTSWDVIGTHAWDPFIVYGNTAYDGYQSALTSKMQDFVVINGYHYNMAEMAAMMTRCGNQLAGNQPPLTCAAFGTDFGLDPDENDSIRNEEWMRFRSLYISAKQQAQQEMAIKRSVEDADYLGYNGCIGNTEFNPLENHFFFPAPLAFPFNYLLTAYFNPVQPCNIFNNGLYKYKIKRFGTPGDLLSSNVNEVAYQQYVLTGQCPSASNLQAFLSEVLNGEKLTASSFVANDFTSFSGLYLALSNYYATPVPVVEWHRTAFTTTLLEADMVVAPSTVAGNISMRLPLVMPVTYTWSNILSFSNLRFMYKNGGQYHFEVSVLVHGTGGTFIDTLTGHTSFNLKDCRFNEVCHRNELAMHLQPLLSALANAGDLVSTAPVQVLGSPSTYTPLVTDPIRHAISSAPISNAFWQYDPVNHTFQLYESSPSSSVLEFQINSMVPATFNFADLGLIQGFSELIPTQSNSFDLVALNGAGHYLVTLKCDAIYREGSNASSVALGDCAQPEASMCKGKAFDNAKTLGLVLMDVLLNQSSEDGYDLSQSIHYTMELGEQILPGLSATSSETEDFVVNGIHHEETLLSFTKQCNLSLRHTDNNNPPLRQNDLVALSDFTLSGARDEWGNYHNFYLLATYQTGGQTYNDTIFGSTSCFSMNVCVLCAEPPAGGRAGLRGGYAPRAAVIRSCEKLYDMYLDTYNAYQLRQQQDPTCPNYPSVFPLLTLQDFIDNNICCNPEGFYADIVEDYLHRFEDGPCPIVALPTYPSCATTYVPQDYPCRETYRSFLATLNAYNFSPWVVTNKAYIPYNIFGSADDFYASGKCYCIPALIAYLEPYIQAGASAVLPAPDLNNFGPCRFSIPESPDTCAYMYQQYLNAYSGFQQFQYEYSSCPGYQVTAPLLSYQDFIDNNICCSLDNMLSTAQNYIYQFSRKEPCPLAPLPAFTACEKPVPTGDPCSDKVRQYMLKLEEYNASAWAQQHHIFMRYTLQGDVGSVFDKCDCISGYISYLQLYIDAAPLEALSDPYSIFSRLNTCQSLNQSCDVAFANYTACVAVFSTWASVHDYSKIKEMNLKTFISEDLCGCTDAYCAYLNDVMDGFISKAEYEANPGIKALCDAHTPPPCAPDVPLAGGEEFPTGVFENPCVEFLTNNALSNAWNAYHQYIDSVKNYMATRYVSHCMGAAETFTRSYYDREYHRTLYYYDQAGNLIKTVPPEGVELLPITSSSDALALKVNQDRLLGTHQVLTSHRLSTRYEYNSLNQLVKQSTPDQDQMNIWDVTLPNGLQAGLNTTAIQMISANRGYLTGYITFGTVRRGLLYRTDNGGTNWTKINHTVAADLKKIQMVSSVVGYAVGEAGTILKTIDGGANWDLLNTYQTGRLLDLDNLLCISSTNVYFVGKGDYWLSTVDGGATFIVNTVTLPISGTVLDANGITPVTGSSVVGVTIKDGTAQYDGVYNSNYNYLEPIYGSYHTAIHYYDATHAVVSGMGQLVDLETPPTGTSFKQTMFKSVYKINGTYFVNRQRGIIWRNKLQFTLDGGTSWQDVDAGSYTSIELIRQTSTSIELIATGSAGVTKRILFTATQNPVVVDQTNYLAPQALDLRAVAKLSEGAGHRLIASADNGKMYASGLMSTGVEKVVYHEIGQLNPSDQSEYALKVVVHSFPGGIASGIILSSTGSIYAIHRTSVSTPFVITGITIGMGVPQFSGLFLDAANQQVFTFENNARRLHRIQLISGSAVGSSIPFSMVLPGSDAVNALAQNAGRITVVGDNGMMYTTNDVSGVNALTTWSERGALRIQPAINAINQVSGDDLVFVGAGGMIARRQGTGTSALWRLTASPRTLDIHAVKTSGSIQLLAGEKGYLTRYNLSTETTTPQMLINGYQSEVYFSGITFKNLSVEGTKTYVCGTNGTVLYSDDILTTPFSFTSGTYTGINFEGISIVPFTSKAYAVGNNSKIYNFNGLTGTQMKNIFPDSLSDVHFADGNRGTIVGANFFVRQTQDGGTTWEIVRPDNNISTQLGAQINRVWTKENGFALLGGVNYLARVAGNLSTSQSYTGTIRRIKFAANNPQNGFMAVDGKVQKIALTPSGSSYSVTPGTAYTSGAVALHGLHVFENGNVMAVGTNFYTAYMNATTGVYTVFSPGALPITFNDVFFHDDVVGYVVGKLGTIFRSKNVTIDPVTHAITALSWEQKLPDAIDQYIANSSIDKLNLKAIAFGSRYDGVFGGYYSSGYINPGYVGCVRKLHDASGDFSTRFFYDRLGRLVLSQNARQYDNNPGSFESKYSYTLYDALGRVYEAGEKAENLSAGLVNRFPGIFGTMVGGQYIPTVIDDAKLAIWIEGVGARTEVTRSYYDESVILGLPVTFTPNTQTQRKRITHVTYEAVYDGEDQTYDHATHYDYDIHGNVQTLLQDNQKMLQDPMLAGQRFKRMDYNYDLVSGNVHRVSYELGKTDQWHHAYVYDADNRITEAFTSTFTPITDPKLGQTASQNEPGLTPYWDQDAKYEYYAHGPLARTELGENRVQGVDHVYTMQGWLKGVNSNTLDVSRDPGKDGDVNGFARDAYGYSLHYYQGDYAPIKTANSSFVAAQATSDLTANSEDLYNGNIARMVTTITNPETREILPLGNAYRYDQLNRIKESRSFTNLNLSANSWGNAGSYQNKYFNTFTYDANGNILTQNRYNASGYVLDLLDYKYALNSNYKKVSNRLYHVNDIVVDAIYPDDIDDMGLMDPDPANINLNNNYRYDAEGRLLRDLQEEIELIDWRVDGKVLKITRPSSSSKKNLIFEYDAMGNRVVKHVLTSADVLEKSTYYILDASGNTMSVYERVVNEDEGTVAFYQAEKHIYGSSRLGMLNCNISLLGAESIDYDMSLTNHVVGKRNYELSNHLGNVLTVISDKPITVFDPSVRGGYYFIADIRVAQDYSPFGVTLDGRKFSISDDYRYGFQGQEHDDEVKGEGNSVNFRYRMHDPRLGRFFAVDPLVSSYPELTPYQFASNSPIFMMELEGLEGKISVTTKWYTDKGIQKSKTEVYTVDGLKADLIKVCWKAHGDPNGPVVRIDYYGRKEDGTRTGNGIKNVTPDAKPTVKELNSFFSTPENSFNVKETEKARVAAKKANERWYDGTIFAPGALEGGDDGANTGNNAAGEQAPAAIKVIVGFIPILAVYNAVSVLTTGTDMYGEEASTNTDKTLAVLGIIGGLGGFTKLATIANASTKVEKVAKTVDKINTGVQSVNDAGGLNEIK